MTDVTTDQALDLDRGVLLGWLRDMLLIRHFEEVAEQLTLRGRTTGMHPAAGQEAVAVGIAAALEPVDAVAATHRDHHHALAAGLPPDRVMAELFGRTTGVVRGRSGSMHLADVRRGFLGGNGIVGAGVGLALGAALAAKLRDDHTIAVGLVGDGGLNTGRTWESANLAGAWGLPLLIVCENNLYAVETPFTSVTAGGSPVKRAEGFGLAAESIDGQDVIAVYRAVRRARDRAVAGGGPSFLEARTYRYTGHGAGERTTYRTDQELEDWRTHRDPIQRLIALLKGRGELTDEELESIQESAATTVREAIEFAERSPLPSAEEDAR